VRATILMTLALAGCEAEGVPSHFNEPPPYYALDGDTIAAGHGHPHIRLTDIDAPELPGHCRSGRVCQPGDPYAARAALQRFLGEGDLACKDKGRDVYGRRIADCWIWTRTGAFNLSQAMYSTGLVGLYEGKRS
jgi:micrococcal nuclease